jgi:hypothetical protein
MGVEPTTCGFGGRCTSIVLPDRIGDPPENRTPRLGPRKSCLSQQAGRLWTSLRESNTPLRLRRANTESHRREEMGPRTGVDPVYPRLKGEVPHRKQRGNIGTPPRT